MNNAIEIEAAPGELIDKLTIRIHDADKRADIEANSPRCGRLRSGGFSRRRRCCRWAPNCERSMGASGRSRMKSAIANSGRILALLSSRLPTRSYRTNDRRAELEREINLLLGPRLIEEKSYRP